MVIQNLTFSFVRKLQQEERSRSRSGPDAVAFVRNYRGTAAGHCQHLPGCQPSHVNRPAIQQSLQRLSAPPVRRFSSRNEICVPAGPHSPVPLPVPAHCQQNSAVRIPAFDQPRSHRCLGQNGRAGSHQFPPHDGNHPPLPSNHGERFGAIENRCHLHFAEDSPG